MKPKKLPFSFLSVSRRIHSFLRRYERTHLWLAILGVFVIASLRCHHERLFYALTGIFIALNLIPLLAAIAVERARASARRGRRV